MTAPRSPLVPALVLGVLSITPAQAQEIGVLCAGGDPVASIADTMR